MNSGDTVQPTKISWISQAADNSDDSSPFRAPKPKSLTPHPSSNEYSPMKRRVDPNNAQFVRFQTNTIDTTKMSLT
jgi:hypothetical protein